MTTDIPSTDTGRSRLESDGVLRAYNSFGEPELRVRAELIAEAAKQYGTPLWLYDADTIRAQVERLSNFDVVRYAQKASSNVHLLKLMRELGVLARLSGRF